MQIDGGIDPDLGSKRYAYGLARSVTTSSTSSANAAPRGATAAPRERSSGPECCEDNTFMAARDCGWVTPFGPVR